MAIIAKQAGNPVRIGLISRSLRVSIDEQHIALPKLYGAPAYARPAAPVATTPRPFDPDDLPIAAVQTDEERELAQSLPAHAWAPGDPVMTSGSSTTTANGASSTDGHSATGTGLRARSFKLKGIAGKLLGGD